MPDLADTDLEVANNALHLIGAETMTAFTDTTQQATVALAVYEDTVREAFEGHRWRFATKQETLTRLSSEPNMTWDAKYRTPFNLVTLINVKVGDAVIDYDRYKDGIYCNATSNDTVVAEYVEQIDPDFWPSSFKLAVQFKLAETFALTLARDGKMSQLMEGRAENQFARARSRDSQQQPTRKLTTSRFIANRRS